VNDFVDTQYIVLLGIALAIGLLIGVERGWKSRQVKDGGRIAGLRTYGLTGLLGGVAGVLSQYLGVMVFGFVFLGFTAAVTEHYQFSYDAAYLYAGCIGNIGSCEPGSFQRCDNGYFAKIQGCVAPMAAKAGGS